MLYKYNCIWNIKHINNGSIIWEITKHNLLVASGGKALVDVFFRNNYSAYFPSTDFYIGLYNGSVSKDTTLITIPGEPSGNGYSRILCERSNTGWPTIEINDNGLWQAVSKEMTITASGGSIGPIDGAFICTSSDNSGTLISALSSNVQSTLLDGEEMTIQLKAIIG